MSEDLSGRCGVSVIVRLKVAERVVKRSSVGSVTMVIARAGKS